MHRIALTYLKENWLASKNRKPLVLRGARQVGKTWLIRQLAALAGKKLIEINFEKTPQASSLFSSNNPPQILTSLSVFLNQEIDISQCLLFLDEIQASPEILAKLRWFYEEVPELPIVAAGSLLEFVLEEHTFSMPVGRISYMHLEPLSFEEFLLARGKERLYDYLTNFQFSEGNEVPKLIHDQVLTHFKEYVLVGGMPAVVSNWVEEQSLANAHQIQNDLLATYRDDFTKYGKRIASDKLDEILMSVPQRIGQKYIYSKVNSAINSQTVKQTLSLFNKARICHRVSGCSANGVPLSSEIKEKYFKEIFLDTGLCSASLGLNYLQIQSANELNIINNGAIAEQVAGQLLRTISPFYIEPSLYYWHREAEGSNAEIDYVIQHGNLVIPIEVKAGKTGSLKSLHLFMESKKKDIAIRINSDIPTKTNVYVKGNNGQAIVFNLLSIPFYLIGQIHRLLDMELSKT
ncbi:MAG: ATP-binding protein [Alphaproteobacteria bacterium]|nr:ATP-binding protein [Alphaproteobacteria bacterium]